MASNILIDVNRCTGCWTCSQACKTAHGLGLDEYRLIIRTIGGGGIDQAGGKWPNLYLKWNPVFKQSCIECHGDSSTNGVPYCAFNCPTGSMVYGDPDDPTSPFSQYLKEAREKTYHVWEQPDWEDTRKGIVYVEKGI